MYKWLDYVWKKLRHEIRWIENAKLLLYFFKYIYILYVLQSVNECGIKTFSLICEQ